jgi:hypothetical protein
MCGDSARPMARNVGAEGYPGARPSQRHYPSDVAGVNARPREAPAA